MTSSDGAWFVYLILTLVAVRSTSWACEHRKAATWQNKGGFRERIWGRRPYKEPPVVKKLLSRIIESIISFKTSRDKNARILLVLVGDLLVVKQQQQKKAMMCISVIKYQTTIGGGGGGGRLLLVIYLLISSPIYILLSTTSLFLILPFLSSFFSLTMSEQKPSVMEQAQDVVSKLASTVTDTLKLSEDQKSGTSFDIMPYLLLIRSQTSPSSTSMRRPGLTPREPAPSSPPLLHLSPPTNPSTLLPRLMRTLPRWLPSWSARPTLLSATTGLSFLRPPRRSL